MAKRWEERLEDFYNSLNRLKESIEDFNKYKIESLKDAVIHRFEFTLEMAWKSIKYYLETEGVIDISTPKQVIREAFAKGLILDGKSWIAMLDDRNLTSHTYNSEIADRIFLNITEKYCKEIELVYITLSKKEIE